MNKKKNVYLISFFIIVLTIIYFQIENQKNIVNKITENSNYQNSSLLNNHIKSNDYKPSKLDLSKKKLSTTKNRRVSGIDLLSDHKKEKTSFDNLLYVKDVFGSFSKNENLKLITKINGIYFYESENEEGNVYFSTLYSKYGVWTGEVIIVSSFTSNAEREIVKFGYEIIFKSGEQLIVNLDEIEDLEKLKENILLVDNKATFRIDLKYAKLKSM